MTDFSGWKEEISFIEKTLSEEGGQIALTEDFIWNGSILHIKSVSKKVIEYTYEGMQCMVGLKFINSEIITLIVNSIKNNKYL